ncbi:MAG: tetratricopeptide repeat protein [Phycisphaerae bacterium]
MKNRRLGVAASMGMLGVVSVLTGCGGGETAVVSFGYALEPTTGLPRGMKVITIEESTVGEATDPKWSDYVTTTMQQLVSDSKRRFGTDLEISDRRDTNATFDEADLRASGMSTGGPGGETGKLLAAQGSIRCHVNTFVDIDKGSSRQITAGSLIGAVASGGRYLRTEEVQEIRRNMTVQADFRLIDTANNKVWEQLPPTKYKFEDEKGGSPFLGGSADETDLESEDSIIEPLVTAAVRSFLSRLIKIHINVEETVESSGNEDCRRGVRLLRAEEFEDALGAFKLALDQSSNDHRAAFGAGVACEATGQFDEAMKYYKQACILDEEPIYMRARDRMKEFGDRAVK